MAKLEKQTAEIVHAAEALEDEIAGLEHLSRSVRKIRLNSDKNLARAAADLKETLALPDRLAARLQEVAAALAHMQERQRTALEPLAAFAIEPAAARAGSRRTHAEPGALGKAAGEISAQARGR